MGSVINASVVFQFFETGYHVDLNWLGNIIKFIVEGVGLVGVGVIVFTLILKAITTPFDIYQRVKMRKQSLIMRGMQDDLDKLKKQYANDKTMYNAKMMELQKKNGYSILGACLPMIVSLVILIFAVNAFQSYSQYANLGMYENMAKVYNEAVIDYAVQGEDVSLQDFNGQDSFVKDGINYRFYTDESGINRIEVSATEAGKYIFYTYSPDDDSKIREYKIDIDKFYTNQTDSSIIESVKANLNAGMDLSTACHFYFEDLGARAAAKWFREENNPSFLWIKNVWYPDVSYSHPIQADYDTFVKSISKKAISDNWSGEREISDVFPKPEYLILTRHLSEEKEQPNGYFIMIILTIGLMVLSQYLSMRSQKESNKYQTLDGQGAKTQKIMMIMMPLIYAVVGFMWTAAFSIYIAMSSIIGIIVTLLSNLIIDRIFKKKEEETIRTKYTRRLPWQDQEQNNKKSK